MGVRSRPVAVALGGALLALPVVASGAQNQPAAKVNAEGNAFTPGSLKFDPKTVTVKVGQIVRWTNTDTVVPHTATEDHKLWRLTGTYGQTPANPPGFGPGDSRQRTFEAGTQHYFCEVHPSQMRAVVRVPVRLAVKQITGGRRVTITWAPGAPAANRAFDVQVKKGSGKWKPFRTGTTKPSGKIERSGAKTLISVRARFRKSGDASQHTDWSPVASVNA
jgi:plastocyanin